MASRRRFGRVRRLRSGRYQVRYRGPDGVDRPAPSTFATKTDAERWLARIEVEIRRCLDQGEAGPAAQHCPGVPVHAGGSPLAVFRQPGRRRHQRGACPALAR